MKKIMESVEYNKGCRGKEKGHRISGRGDRQGKGEQERNGIYLLKDTRGQHVGSVLKDRKDWKGICDLRENEKQSKCSQNKTFRRLQYGKAGACDTKNRKDKTDICS